MLSSSTLGEYLQVTNNLDRYEKITEADPIVKSQTAYYKANISSVKTPSDLVNNYRLFSYVLTAYGLGDDVNQKALFKKVLQQGTGSTSNLAYTLNDPRILALAKTFNFAANGTSTTSSTNVTNGVVNQYIEQTLETNEGQSNTGVQLALYFQRNAPNIKSVYNILADKSLLTVVQTALGISSLTSLENVDTQAKLIAKKLNISDFQDPKKLQKFIQKFCAMYDINNTSSTSSSSSSSGSVLSLFGSSSDTTGFTTTLLSKMQGIRF